MSEGQVAVECQDLTKRFGSTEALAGVNLRAEHGTVLGLLGPNGAGKTTVIRTLATLLQPDRGRAAVAGLDVMDHPAEVRRLIGLTGQYATVDDDLTGAENLTLIGRLLDLTAVQARTRAADLLAEFDLTDAAGRRVSTYSGGMRRRLDLAASLVGRPQIIFLDEPTTGLDPGKRVELWRTIRTLADSGHTVLLTTQYLEEADALADQIAVIDHGRVIAYDTPAGLKHQLGGQTVVVRPVDPAFLPAAAEVVEHVLGDASGDVQGGVLTAPIEDDEMFAAIVCGLHAAAVPVAELALRLPSLDEVFFSLTHNTTSDTTERLTGAAS